MHVAGKVLRGFESPLDECLVDDYFCSHVRQFTPLPGFHLLSHRLEVSLHSVDSNRDAVDERERLRVFRQHPREHARDTVSQFGPPSISTHQVAIAPSTWLPAVRGSTRLKSLSSPSQVACQSSPSTQVTPVTKRLDSMVRRIAPVSGST